MHGVLFGKIEPVPQAHSRHDADGDFRGGGDEDGDDDDEDYGEDKYDDGDGADLDWIWLRSVLIRIIKWNFAWHRARLDLDSLESDTDALVRMRVFPSKSNFILKLAAVAAALSYASADNSLGQPKRVRRRPKAPRAKIQLTPRVSKIKHARALYSVSKASADDSPG